MNSSVIRLRKRAFASPPLAFIVVLAAAGSTLAQESETVTLRRAVTLAVQNSRELKLARVQYQVALDEVNVRRAGFRPNLYTGAGWAYTHGFPSLPGGAAPSLFELNYTQTLFNPLLKADQHAAEEHAKNQKLEMDRMRDDIIVHTASVYLELAKVQHSLELLRAEEASAEKILAVVQERVAASQELPIEATRSELALARVRERIVKLSDRSDILTAEVRDLTGLADSQPLRVETDEPPFADALANQPAEPAWLDSALQNDPSVAEAEHERAAREHLLHGAKLSYWPTVDLVGQYSVLSKFNNYQEFYKAFERNNVNVGVQVSIPIFAARTSSNVALAKSQLNAAELQLSQKRQNARLDLRQKYRGMQEVDATREVARLDLRLAQETLQLVQAKFDQGRATLQEVEQARLDESDKWVAFLDANYTRQQEQLDVLKATGQLAIVFP